MGLSGRSERIHELKNKIKEIELSWPAHNPSPAMFGELEDLQEELESLQSGSEGEELNAETASDH